MLLLKVAFLKCFAEALPAFAGMRGVRPLLLHLPVLLEACLTYPN